jgi:hypothetical protein
MNTPSLAKKADAVSAGAWRVSPIGRADAMPPKISMRVDLQMVLHGID